MYNTYIILCEPWDHQKGGGLTRRWALTQANTVIVERGLTQFIVSTLFAD